MRVMDDYLPGTNYWRGRPAGPPTFVILHATAGSTYAGARAAYLTRGVSAHVTIEKDGTVYRNVPEEHRAFHAGTSRWGTLEELNHYSLGLEMVGLNQPDSGYPKAQVDAAFAVVRDWCKRYDIPWTHVLTHAMISPGRKTDPANFVDYPRLLESLAELKPFANPQGRLEVDVATINGRDFPIKAATVAGRKLFVNTVPAGAKEEA